MKKNISIIDIDAGNLHSVYKAFKYIGTNAQITRDPKIVEKSDAIVFPGIGAFGAVMGAIRKNNLEDTIKKTILSSRPFLGICLGLQVLFERSEENPNVKGLEILEGNVIKFKTAKKIPHIGWNDVVYKIRQMNEKFYFVHSYYVLPANKTITYSTTDHDGEVFTSMIKKDNLLAVQFHPEKSGDVGLEFLKNFCSFG